MSAEVRALGDRLKGAADIFKLLSRVDIADLTQLGQLVSVLSGTAPVADKITAALQAMTLITKMTPNPEDDKIAATITSMLSPDIVALLVKVVEMALGGGDTRAAAFLTADERSLADAKMIPVPLLIEIGMQLAQLIMSLRRK